jgi:hypothetical protein
MLDAELPEGDLTQVTQAIQNALRPNPAIQSRAIAAPVLAPRIDDVQPVEDEQDISDDPAATPPKPARAERASRPRRYPSPEVIEVDLLSELSFSDYVADKKIDSDADRFLTVAAWFKEYRKVNEITVNHVYTCYRAAHWPTNIEDFAKPLRHLKSRKLMTSPSRGLFSINHIGLAQVTALSNG